MSVTANQVLNALADPTRRALFERLCRVGEQNVSSLTQHAQVSQSAVSKHLVILKEAGLVRDRKEGRDSCYRAKPRGLIPLVNWIGIYTEFWRSRFDDLEDVLNRRH